MALPLEQARSDVTVRPATPREHVTIENLMQLYVHDFSEHWGGEAKGDMRGEVGRDGRFEPYPLARYWRDPRWVAYLICKEDRIAGFMLMNADGHSGLPIDHNVAEFFVLRKHRRSGIGGRAAQIVFKRHPGVWEAAVVRRNSAALTFWRKTISGCAGVSGIEEIDSLGPAWDGPIVRFRIDAS